MKPRRSTSLSLALAVAALAPAAAIAKNGADDNPAIPDDHGGQIADVAKGGGSSAKRVAGDCSGRSTSKLKVKPDGGRLETEFEVDQNRNGVTWKVTIQPQRSPRGQHARDHEGSQRLLQRRAPPAQRQRHRPDQRAGDQPVGRGLQGRHQHLTAALRRRRSAPRTLASVERSVSRRRRTVVLAVLAGAALLAAVVVHNVLAVDTRGATVRHITIKAASRTAACA